MNFLDANNTPAPASADPDRALVDELHAAQKNGIEVLLNVIGVSAMVGGRVAAVESGWVHIQVYQIGRPAALIRVRITAISTITTTRAASTHFQ